MRESDRTLSRRTFLRRMLVGAAVVSTALVVGEEVWDALERLAPRRLMVPGAAPWSAGLFDVMGGESLTQQSLRAAMQQIYESLVLRPDHMVISERLAGDFAQLSRGRVLCLA